MSADVRKVITNVLNGFQDDLLEFIISAVEDMSTEDKKSFQSINDLVSPFLMDTGYVNDEEAAMEKSKAIAQCFGGSGFKTATKSEVDDTPALLAAPVKLIDNSGLKTSGKATYGATFMASSYSGPSNGIAINSNTQFDASSIPTTQKQARKMKKESDDLQRILAQEARDREREAKEIAEARMAAIKASRAHGRQSLTGVNIDRFTLPHPSGTGDLLSDAALVLSPGRRYGLVGRNGAGKSTLLKALARYQLEGLTHLRIMLVDQHVEGDDHTPLEWVLNADIERTSLLHDEALLSSHLYGTATTPLPDDLKGVNLELALQEIYERMELIGVATAETRAKKILSGLGFSESMMIKPTNKLSGGWAMRAALSAAVFVRPNLLLLDEPTNHLDLHALVWLEAWITNHYSGITMIVSHDRYFLGSVCTDIIEFRSTLAGQKKNSLEHYVMDYDSFEHELDERKLVQARARVAYEKERDKLKEFISREGRKFDNPAHQSQRKMKMKQLEQLIEIEEVEEEVELVLVLPKPYGYFGDDVPLITISDMDYGYDVDDDGYLFEKVNFQVESRSRIAILGKNGCGKTTLLQLLTGELNPKSGKITRHPGSRIAMLQQHHYRGEQLDPFLNPLEHLRRLPQDDSTAVGVQDMGTRQEETAHRSYLANFGVHGWRATVPVKNLSGGQRMRVAMAVALYRRPDCIILDEPTNHLDRDTVRALAEALEKFEGAIIVVSHDEDFVNRVLASKNTAAKGGKTSKDDLGGHLWVLSKKQLQRFEGSFKDYKNIILKRLSLVDDF